MLYLSAGYAVFVLKSGLTTKPKCVVNGNYVGLPNAPHIGYGLYGSFKLHLVSIRKLYDDLRKLLYSKHFITPHNNNNIHKTSRKCVESLDQQRCGPGLVFKQSLVLDRSLPTSELVETS